MFATSLRRAMLPGLLGLTLLIAAAQPLASPTTARAQSVRAGAWLPPVPVSGGGAGPAEPALAYDSQGFMHVVFFAGESENNWKIYYVNNRAGSWSAPRLLITLGGTQRAPDIAVGPDNRIHVIYNREGPGNIVHIESSNFGATWSKPETVTDSPDTTIWPALAVDNNNTLHAVWCDRRWGDFGVTYAQKPLGGTWSAPRPIGLGAFERKTNIAVTGSGPGVQVHIVFEGRVKDTDLNTDFDIYYVRGNGAVFDAPRDLSNDPGIWSLNPTIASDGLSQLYVAWQTQDQYHDVAFTRSTNLGTSWVPFTNLTRREGGSFWPQVAYGLDDSRQPQVHIVWFEEPSGDTSDYYDVYYLRYNPVTNSFGQYIEQLGSRATASAPAGVADAPTSGQVSVASQTSRPRQIVITSKGGGTFVGGALRLNGGAAASKSRQLTAELYDLIGDPNEMRYAWGRVPDDRDAWQQLSAPYTFGVGAPEGGCEQRLYVQLRAGGARLSSPIEASIQVDTAVQALVSIHNPGVGDPGYSSSGFVDVDVRNQGECSGLRRLTTAEGSYTIDNSGISVRPQLSDPRGEGPREVSALVEDAVGNTLAVSRTITIDRTLPRLAGGASLQVAAPPGGLLSPLATLDFSGVMVDDTYQGGFWGVEAANIDASAPQGTASPSWRAVEVAGHGQSFALRNWNVLSGLGQTLSGGSLGGRQIEVRVRFLDGAGNPSSETLSATVRLADDAQPLQAFLPLAQR